MFFSNCIQTRKFYYFNHNYGLTIVLFGDKVQFQQTYLGNKMTRVGMWWLQMRFTCIGFVIHAVNFMTFTELWLSTEARLGFIFFLVLCAGTLCLCSASWPPWTKQPYSTIRFCRDVSHYKSTNHGLKLCVNQICSALTQHSICMIYVIYTYVSMSVLEWAWTLIVFKFYANIKT